MSVVEASRFAQVRSPAEIPTQLTVHHPCARRHSFSLKVGVEGTDAFGSRRRAASPLQVVVRPPWTCGEAQATRASAGQAASSREGRWG